MTTRPQPSSLRPPKDTATQPRTIGGRRISGEDIDWYFDRYLEWFHPLVPVLRNRDPDACYQASPTLFWMVVMLACRRYPRDANEAADGNGDSQGRGGEASKETEGEGERDGADGPLYRVLTEYLDRDIWTVLSEPVTKLESIHALLLYCAWPMRADRLVADPSTVLAGIALNVSMLVGLHTGRGSHPEFCVGRRRNMSFTDEDAAVTWVIACILAQR